MTKPAAAFAALLLLTLAIAALALQPPAPRPANAPATEFSARRAFPVVEAIARRPHPTGSAESAAVREMLVAQMSVQGLSPAVRPGVPPNIVGVLGGTDPALPALALMAHYDSVPAGPGAGDDAAGVAAALEIVRALKASRPHRRDVMVVITDGEEAGLLGAKTFFGSDPLAARVGVVINMEARGNRGRAAMFQTHRDAGAMVAALRRAGALTGASSLMPDLYRRLPNDTDLTVALDAGKQGLNFAFFANQAAYHTAEDTPANLSLGSLQHIGQQGLAAARVIVDLPALPAPAPDQVYGDILGGPEAAYPVWAGWALIGVALALTLAVALRAVARRQATGLEMIRGAIGFVLVVLATGLALGLADQAVAAGRVDFHALLARYPLVLAGYGLVGLGALMLALSAVTRTRGRWLATTPEALSIGALLATAAAAAALQAAAPLDAFILAWPLLAAAAARALPAQGPARWLAAAITALTLAQVCYWAGFLFSLAGIGLPVVLAPFAGLGLLAGAPYAARAAGVRAGPLLGASSLAGGAACLAIATLWPA